LLFGNSRPRVATTPFPHATGAYGQLPGRDFNPLDLLLLLLLLRAISPARDSSQPGPDGVEHLDVSDIKIVKLTRGALSVHLAQSGLSTAGALANMAE